MLAGCGIRSTSVPVDAGAAPSRVGCVLTENNRRGGEGASAVRIFLVCGSRVAPVEREVKMPQGRSSAERLPVARRLLEELRRQPDAEEGSAGFETALPADLRITRRAAGDPEEALRLNTPVRELPPFALGQLVCTLADTAAADANHAVTLGGPPDEPGGELQRYECGTALRTRPEAAETAGTRV
ncbi:hypothetical protein G5C65_07965 [Streptomyces sp. SB3404]|uniref:Uncharacterized protein n=1 Tax=Streptomyces boncukensis TaxID=2711219 RepID=A0A6G4WSN5_9ACTN|nr:hypothetical protein [Streptomyces boncukensis]